MRRTVNKDGKRRDITPDEEAFLSSTSAAVDPRAQAKADLAATISTVLDRKSRQALTSIATALHMLPGA